MSVIDKFLKTKNPHRPFCSVVIVAAGNSQRMGADKILMEIGGIPVIVRTLMAFQNSGRIDEIVVVTKMSSLVDIADICNKYEITKASKVICGGKTRAESALNGVSETNPNAELIAVHDGARPFVTAALIERTVIEAENSRAAAPAVIPVDTVRIMNRKGEVAHTPDRNHVMLVQTPQVFHADLIKGALTKAVEKNLPITDDCSAVEAMGFKVSIVAGDADNIKLTTSKDIYIGEKILRDRGDRF